VVLSRVVATVNGPIELDLYEVTLLDCSGVRERPTNPPVAPTGGQTTGWLGYARPIAVAAGV
jgi:hypothetical protein